MTDTKATISALRAVSAITFRRFMKPVLVITSILLVAAYVITALLALSFSAWWWLLLFIFIPVTFVVSLVIYIGHFLLKRLQPRELSRDEHQQIDDFAEKLFGLAERSQTPRVVILFLIAKDVLRGKESAFIRQLIGDSRDITKDFEKIQALFRP